MLFKMRLFVNKRDNGDNPIWLFYMTKKILYNAVMNKKAEQSDELKIVKMPYKKLKVTKEEQHLSISKISAITNVSRDVVSRFLDGHKINHIDYIKIAQKFPEIQEVSEKTTLKVTPVTVFGTVETGGYVRGLYLNEQKEFLLDKPLKSIFTEELIVLHDSFTNNKFVCIHRPNKVAFTRFDHNYMFLVKTKTDCWFGLIKEHNNYFCLHDRHSLKPITVGELEIIEVFEMLGLFNGRWNELKDKNLNSVIER